MAKKKMFPHEKQRVGRSSCSLVFAAHQRHRWSRVRLSHKHTAAAITPNIQHAAVSIFIAANESTLMTSEYRAHERPLMIIRDNIIITRVVARLNILSGCARLYVC